MVRAVLASLLGIAALFAASLSVISWSTSSDEPRASAPDPIPQVAAVAEPVSPAPAASAPATPIAAPASRVRPPAPVPPPLSAQAARRATEAARARADGRRPDGGRAAPSRIVTSARDRHLVAAHPDILAARRAAANDSP